MEHPEKGRVRRKTSQSVYQDTLLSLSTGGSRAFPGNLWSGRRTGCPHRCIFTGLPHALPLLPQPGDRSISGGEEWTAKDLFNRVYFAIALTGRITAVLLSAAVSRFCRSISCWSSLRWRRRRASHHTGYRRQPVHQGKKPFFGKFQKLMELTDLVMLISKRWTARATKI